MPIWKFSQRSRRASGYGGGDAACRSSRDTQSWHDRRQLVARRPRGGAADAGRLLRCCHQGAGAGRSPGNSREDFFVSALTNRLEPDEIVFEIDFPVLKAHTGWAFEEVARRFGDFALACIAVSFELRDGRIADARVAVMGVADTPRRLREAEDALRGAKRGAESAARFAEIVRSCVSPSDDIHVSAEYRKNLIGALAEKAFATAWARAAGHAP